ncbi:substrate-binding domain-containing protein, partial [Streptomyces rochei]|uniref:substrate-binding domain-containing protein n=1 Tax=Streptomyces rochei TaxID=1928 RepID=UPI003703306B
MKACTREAALAMSAVSTAVALAACGPEAGKDSDGDDAPRIGLLLPDATTARWEGQDRPLLERKIDELCADCAVEHTNAKGDVAIQQEQMNSMIAKGVDAIVLVAVDARSLGAAVRKADEADIPVIAYDRLAEGPIAGYVSFDGEEVGKLQGRSLLKAMGEKADDENVVMMNGDPTSPNAASYRKGALSVLKGKTKIAKSYDNLGWTTANAHANMSAAVSALGPDRIGGVLAANDAIAAGVIAALKAAHVRELPPITGQDAELAAVQRVIRGEQYMTVYKPFKAEAAAAAAMAVALGRGEDARDIATTAIDSPTTRNIPSVLLTPTAVTADTIKQTLVKD